MTAQRIIDLNLDGTTLPVHRYLFGSRPAWTRSGAEIRDELLAGICYQAHVPDHPDPAYLSFLPLARPTSGVWLIETLVPEAVGENYWRQILEETVREHLHTQLTARLVQRFSTRQRARATATHALGWILEGTLAGYYRLRTAPTDAEQWALMAGATA